MLSSEWSIMHSCVKVDLVLILSLSLSYSLSLTVSFPLLVVNKKLHLNVDVRILLVQEGKLISFHTVEWGSIVKNLIKCLTHQGKYYCVGFVVSV